MMRHFTIIILLNVNIPKLSLQEIKGIKITRQGKRIYNDSIVEKVDPRGKKYYWIGGNELGSICFSGHHFKKFFGVRNPQ